MRMGCVDVGVYLGNPEGSEIVIVSLNGHVRSGLEGADLDA